MLWGRRIVTETRITEYEANTLLSFDYVSGPFRVRGSRSFESVERGTLFTYTLESEAIGLRDRLLVGMTGTFFYRRLLEGYVARMKTILETNDQLAAESAG